MFLTASSAHAVLNIASFVVVLVVKPLVKKLQICILGGSEIKLDYTGSYWIKLDQIRSNFEKAILKKAYS